MSLDTASFVAFLRMEADLSDEKAKRLRAQADELAQQHGITVEMESSYGTCFGCVIYDSCIYCIVFWRIFDCNVCKIFTCQIRMTVNMNG